MAEALRAGFGDVGLIGHKSEEGKVSFPPWFWNFLTFNHMRSVCPEAAQGALRSFEFFGL